MAGPRATPTRTPPRPSSPAASTEAVVPPDWASAVALVSSHDATPPPVVVVCGPKNSGKSTFSRVLLNALLPRHGKVGYLDTDVGQPVFGPPGCLSFHVVDEAIKDLLNPTLQEAERDPEAYLNCLFHLYDYFVGKYRCDENEMLPLIVNTPGWVKGAGFDMLVEMLRYICPTLVVQIRITMQSKNLPDGMFWLDGDQTGPRMININAVFHDALNRSLLIQKDSYGMRERRLVEYLKQCFPRNISLSTIKELAYALASLPPYQVPFSDVKVVHLHCEVPAGEIWRSLNATIVGLAVSDASEATRAIPYCVGLGIVRGIDVQEGVLYVITPVPLERLQDVNLLQQGLIEIPTSLYRSADVCRHTCQQMYCTRYQKGIYTLVMVSAGRQAGNMLCPKKGENSRARAAPNLIRKSMNATIVPDYQQRLPPRFRFSLDYLTPDGNLNEI